MNSFVRDLEQGCRTQNIDYVPLQTDQSLGTALSTLESQVLTCYLEGRSYEEIGDLLGCDPKTVDNALQRVKRKVLTHLQSRRITA